MAFAMAKNSLFAVLLRSPWWYSVVTGMVLIAISAVLFDGQYLPLGIFAALPFFGIACFAGYRQSKLPSQKRIQEVDEQARKMPARKIAEKIADSYTRERFDSAVFKGNEAELELTRGNRKYLLSSKRFKVANTGVEPLKQMVAAGEKIEVTGYLYVALGEISSAARAYADQNGIELVQADRLAAFFDHQAQINI